MTERKKEQSMLSNFSYVLMLLSLGAFMLIVLLIKEPWLGKKEKSNP